MDDITKQLTWITEVLDELGIPKATKIGAPYSVYGRVKLMADELLALRGQKLVADLEKLASENSRQAPAEE